MKIIDRPLHFNALNEKNKQICKEDRTSDNRRSDSVSLEAQSPDESWWKKTKQAIVSIMQHQEQSENLRAACSVSRSDNPETEKEWTILHYAGADNNLGQYWLDNLNEMEAVGSRENLNIVSQLDLKDIGCKRYLIKKDDDIQNFTSPAVEDLGRVNMADPEVLTEFIKYGMKKYPAKHYMLIIACHGGAWKGLQLEDSFAGGDMSVPSIRRSIENAEMATNRHLDLLAFDACLMGSAEAAYELRNVADYMVASEQVEAFKSWPYTPILKKAFEETDKITPDKLGTIVVDESSKVKQDMLTMGLIDLSRMENVKDAANALAEEIITTKTSMSVLKNIARKTQQFYLPVKDMYHFAQQIAENPSVKDTALIEAAENLCRSIREAVLTEEHSTSVPPRELITDSDLLALSEAKLKAVYELNGANGLNTELNPHYTSYGSLQFAEDTEWVKAMRRIDQAA